MTIGILGSGKVGKALGAWASERGQKVAFCSRTEAHAQEAARAAGNGAEALPLAGLIGRCDMLLLTLPFGEIEPTLAPFQSTLAGSILVDVTNPITPDHRGLTIGHTDSGAETLARAFPGAKVVKAFNAIFAEVYAARRVSLGGHAISTFYAGDDAEAKGRVRELLELLGFDAVDAGPLRNARYLEPLSLLNIHLGRELGFGTQIGFALLREG